MIRIACIGSGYWGKNLIRNFYSLQDCDLSCICDDSPDVLKQVSRQYPDVASTSDFSSVLANPEIDAVVIATPAPSHYDLARQALIAGKHTYVEKPLTLTSGDAESLIALAEENNRILMVGHLMEYHPAVLKLHEIIQSGELGDIFYVYSQRLNLGIVRDKENAFWSLAPHDISIIQFLLPDAVPIRIQASGRDYLQHGIEDVVFAVIEFADKCMAHIHVSWLDPHKTRKITVVGSKKMAVFDDMESSEKIRIYDKCAGPKAYDSYGDAITLHYGDIRIPHIQMTEPLKQECKEFITAIATGIPPRSDGQDGLRVVKILEAAQQSIAEGGIPVGIVK